MANDQVSAIVVSYRMPELTRQAVTSALNAGVTGVVVVDNDPEGGLASILDGLGNGRLQVVSSSRNEGFGTAVNAGALHAGSGTLLLLNSDAEITTDALSALQTELTEHGPRAIVGPRLVEPDGTVQRSAGLLPGPVDLLVRGLGLHRMGKALAPFRSSRLLREYESAVSATEPMTATMVSGACFAIGREAFMELGGFDEQFFMYFEDADLCRRAAAAGMPIRYVPDAVVTHIGGGSSSEDYHFGPLHARSMRQYLGKWYGPSGSALALLILWIRAVCMSLTLQGGARRARRAWWAAVRDEDPRR